MIFVFLLIVAVPFLAWGWDRCDRAFDRLAVMYDALEAKYNTDMQIMNDRCTQQSLDHIAASKRDVQLMQQLRVENDALRRRLEDLTRPPAGQVEDECPADCSFCTGEACNKCGAGCWADGSAPHCEHDCSERHEDPAIREIQRIKSESGPIEQETSILLDLAEEAQRTGRMPDLSKLSPFSP